MGRFVIGLANPGFLLIGLWGPIIALGGQVAIILWVVSAFIGALQGLHLQRARGDVPDKPGGLSVYAEEGCASTLVLRADRGVRLLVRLVERAGDLRKPDRIPAHRRVRRRRLLRDDDLDPPLIVPWWAQLIGVMCIVLCWIFNVEMRPAVGLSYVVGALMVIPILVIAIGAFVTGDFSNHEINSNFVAANVEFYGDSPTGFNQFVMIMVWMLHSRLVDVRAGPWATFALEYKDTANDTRKALASVGALNVVLAFLPPIAVLGTIGYDALYGDRPASFG